LVVDDRVALTITDDVFSSMIAPVFKGLDAKGEMAEHFGL
jgi:hypothetical protein